MEDEYIKFVEENLDLIKKITLVQDFMEHEQAKHDLAEEIRSFFNAILEEWK